MELKIKNKHEEKPIQQFWINSKGEGHLECPTMVDSPDNKKYTILPFNIEIELTKFEPKHPHFRVIRRSLS